MELDFGHVFNLMDTNGRRGDVVNALNIYLSILKEAHEKTDPFEWTAFPNSLNQYLFYQRAVEESPEVFIDHPKYDYFKNKYNGEINLFISGQKEPLINKMSHEDRVLLDVAIESRARHYSSNLCKLGLASVDRKITPVGEAFLGKTIEKDALESILPLSDTNIVLIRQLLKLKVFSKSVCGCRKYYSPFLMAIYLLLTREHVTTTDFRFIIQSSSPYSDKTPDELIDDYYKNTGFAPIIIDYPNEVTKCEMINRTVFDKYYKNSKSGKSIDVYWDFYESLYCFKSSQNDQTYSKLLAVLRRNGAADKIKKAFGFGKPVFDFVNQNYDTDIALFCELNKDNELFSSSLCDFNKVFYKRFIESKYFDAALEYSDTTKRILSATGLFKFERGISVLAYKELLEVFFDKEYLLNNIFGQCSNEEYVNYEDGESSYYCENHSTISIMSLTQEIVLAKINKIENKFGVSINLVTELVRDKTNKDFVEHINQKYPKSKVLELMRMFEDRSNDKTIKEYVNPEASVPTIYEYITALAWYYLSNKTINVYDSLNLTLNADFEPVLHAGGGDGDIIIKEDNRVTMLEVTLMNRGSQGRGEMEPVLRHSTNLKARYSGIDTFTFFIACELDTNTVNLWRFILSQEQIASLNSQIVSGIIIMSFTNNEMCKFIENNVSSDLIIEKTRESFKNGTPEHGWRDKIVNSLIQ